MEQEIKKLIASNIVKSEWYGKLSKEDKAFVKSLAGKKLETNQFKVDNDGDIEIKNFQSKTLIISKRYVYDC